MDKKTKASPSQSIKEISSINKDALKAIIDLSKQQDSLKSLYKNSSPFESISKAMTNAAAGASGFKKLNESIASNPTLKANNSLASILASSPISTKTRGFAALIDRDNQEKIRQQTLVSKDMTSALGQLTSGLDATVRQQALASKNIAATLAQITSGFDQAEATKRQRALASTLPTLRPSFIETVGKFNTPSIKPPMYLDQKEVVKAIDQLKEATKATNAEAVLLEKQTQIAVLEQNKILSGLAEQNGLVLQAITQLINHTVEFEKEKAHQSGKQETLAWRGFIAAVASTLIGLFALLYQLFWQKDQSVIVYPQVTIQSSQFKDFELGPFFKTFEKLEAPSSTDKEPSPPGL